MTSVQPGDIAADFLSGGGELGQLIGAFDWSKTLLGPIETWPPSLRITLGVVLGSPVPIVTLWGDEGVIGVTGLYSAIYRGMRRIDMAPRREPEITPHMTLVYDKAEVPETFIEPISWRVEEFVLIHAVHGEGRFEVVGRVPLNG